MSKRAYREVRPFSWQPLCDAHESRQRYAVSGRQPFSRQTFSGATEPAKQYAVAGRGISRSAERGRTALPRGAKRIDNLRFSILLGLQLSLGDTSERRNVPFLLRGGTEKGTAVPLPIHRPQSAIPLTATLKPLAVCDSIYAKPVQSAATTPRQREKRQPIPVLVYELLTK